MNWPGEQLLIKLWGTLANNGVGGLLKPWQIRRVALAQVEAKQLELVALADAEREADDIRSGRLKLVDSRYALALSSPDAQGEKRVEPTIDERPPIEVATSVVIADALRREINASKAITCAESELKDDTQTPSERDIEPDWLYRWRDYAGSVSSEELQALWGRLLAGELKAPGAYSYRTLDFIRNLTADEARKIGRLSPFVIDDIVVRSQLVHLENEGILFGDLLELQDLGIISGIEGVGLNVAFESIHEDHFLCFLRSHGRVLIVRHDNPKRKVELKAYKVTALGQEVLRLGKFDPHEKYLQAVGKELKKAGAAVSIANYRYVSVHKFETFDERAL